MHLYTHAYMKVKNGSYEQPYTDPGAPVHIVTGAAVSDIACIHPSFTNS